jgi:hypothetical protein
MTVEQHIQIYALEDSIKRVNISHELGDDLDISYLIEEAHFILGKTSGTLTDYDYILLIDELMKVFPGSELL